MIDDEELARLEAVRRRKDPREHVTLDHDPNVSGVRFVTHRDGMALSGHMDYVDGRLMLVSLTVRRANGVSTGTLRRVRLPELVAELRAAAMVSGFGTYVYADSGEPVHSLATRRRARELAEAAARSDLKKGRRGYGDDHYRRIAFAYLDHIIEERGGGLLKSIAAAESDLQGREVPVETVRTWVSQARKRGFLTAGQPGRAIAEPGPNLYEIKG